MNNSKSRSNSISNRGIISASSSESNYCCKPQECSQITALVLPFSHIHYHWELREEWDLPAPTPLKQSQQNFLDSYQQDYLQNSPPIRNLIIGRPNVSIKVSNINIHGEIISSVAYFDSDFFLSHLLIWRLVPKTKILSFASLPCICITASLPCSITASLLCSITASLPCCGLQHPCPVVGCSLPAL